MVRRNTAFGFSDHRPIIEAEKCSGYQPAPEGIVAKTRGVEGNMEKALSAVQLLFYLLSGLGLLFMGIGALWFVDVYNKKKSE
jgi:hypothetical protein